MFGQKSKIFFILFALPFLVAAQDMNGDSKPPSNTTGNAPVGDQDVQLLYRNDFSIGGLIHSAGFGLNFRRGKHITGFKRGILEIELVNVKHPKEVKTQNQLFENSKGYFYGKLNVLNILRPGVGFQTQLYGKSDRRGVEVNLITFIGPSFGLAKPVYLQILNDIPSTTNPNDYIISTEKYDPEIHFTDRIYGRAPYFKGFNETKVFPGGYAKLALNFEYGAMDDDIKAIETGVCLDIYAKPVPVMANTENNQIYFTVYLHFLYGKRWF